jgi:hypothetical protein
MAIKYSRTENTLLIMGTTEELNNLNACIRNGLIGHNAVQPVIVEQSNEILITIETAINKLNDHEYRAHNKSQANGRAIPRRAVPAGRYQVGEEIGRFKIIRLGKAWRPSPQEKYKWRIGADVEFIQYAYFE